MTTCMNNLQEMIFEKELSRKELLEYNSQNEKTYRVCVYRNHSFELIEHTIDIYLDYARLGVEFIYSDYDDSLSFIEMPMDVDALILWLDLERYQMDTLDAFIEERISYLTQKFKKPVLFAPLSDSKQKWNTASVLLFSFERIRQKLQDQFYDRRMESFTGTRLSAKAISEISKELGMIYIPALLTPTLKAIVLDLDNTLYRGVLGEDGIGGVELTEGHKRLQNKLKEFGKKGIFLCLASKNEENDVRELFQSRSDFPLGWNDFAKTCISWTGKERSVQEIATFLNIGTDSILFIDDNPGEIAAVVAANPKIWTLRAYEEAEKTCQVLDYYPRLYRCSVNFEDEIRSKDAVANQERDHLKASLSKEEYLKSLNMKLVYSMNDINQVKRISELANKTNQFIFNYKRYSVGETAEYMEADDKLVITMSLSDRLSDSGIIGACFAAKQEDYILVDEIFVSCRALGRGIEDIIVLGAIQCACKKLDVKNIRICFQKGERNLPAQRFVQQYLKEFLNESENFQYEFEGELLNIEVKGEGR